MTVAEYLHRLDTLIDAHRWREALAAATAGMDDIWLKLSNEELDYVTGMMEIAANIVEIEDSTDPAPPAPAPLAPSLDVDTGTARP